MLCVVNQLELCHFDGVNGTFITLISQFAAATVFCLLQVVGREQPVDDRSILSCIEPGYTVSHSLTNIVKMRCLATDDTAENDDGIVTSV